MPTPRFRSNRAGSSMSSNGCACMGMRRRATLNSSAFPTRCGPWPRPISSAAAVAPQVPFWWGVVEDGRREGRSRRTTSDSGARMAAIPMIPCATTSTKRRSPVAGMQVAGQHAPRIAVVRVANVGADRRGGRIPSSAAACGLVMPAARDHGVAPPPQGLRQRVHARAGSVGLKNETCDPTPSAHFCDHGGG